ncbi:MAG: hypothetical protein ACRBDI_05775 [Alphaproteobacteria bacterium]
MTNNPKSRYITADQFNNAVRPHIMINPATINNFTTAPEGHDIPEITKIKTGEISFNDKSSDTSIPFTFKSPGIYVTRETEDGKKFIGTDRFQLLPPNKKNEANNLEILYYHKGKDTYENLLEGDFFTFAKPANNQPLNADFMILLETHLLKQNKNGQHALINPETSDDNRQGFINGTSYEGHNQNIIPIDVEYVTYNELFSQPPKTNNESDPNTNTYTL